MRIVARALTAAEFAPFGTVVGGGEVGPIWNGRPHVGPRLRWSVADVTALPHRATVVERHRLSSQCFVPCDPAAHWLVLVMPSGVDGQPDPAGVRAFVATGQQALTYAPDTWHHPLAAIGAAARFAVLTHLDDGPDDTEFVTLPVAIDVLPPE